MKAIIPPKSMWVEVKFKEFDKPVIAPWGYFEGPNVINLIHK